MSVINILDDSESVVSDDGPDAPVFNFIANFDERDIRDDLISLIFKINLMQRTGTVKSRQRRTKKRKHRGEFRRIFLGYS
jgi:hypothetical protein